ncbi:polysaccharide biosynthesis/export family protein [Sphingomonas sp. UYP23]
MNRVFGAIILIAMTGFVGTANAQTAMGVPAKMTTATMIDDYKLASGDKVRIIVYGEDAMTGEYSVTDAGFIDFPLVGKVPAGGLSLKDVTSVITRRLAEGYIKDPRVSAEVVDYRPFYILGEVQKPGKYPFATSLTLQQAVAAAGGFTYRANLKKIYLRRQGQDTEVVVNAKAGPINIMPGDTIRVSERFF